MWCLTHFIGAKPSFFLPRERKQDGGVFGQKEALLLLGKEGCGMDEIT